MSHQRQDWAASSAVTAPRKCYPAATELHPVVHHGNDEAQGESMAISHASAAGSHQSVMEGQQNRVSPLEEGTEHRSSAYQLQREGPQLHFLPPACPSSLADRYPLELQRACYSEYCRMTLRHPTRYVRGYGQSPQNSCNHSSKSYYSPECYHAHSPGPSIWKLLIQIRVLSILLSLFLLSQIKLIL